MTRPSHSASIGHGGHVPSSGRALTLSAWLTGVYFVIELAVGLWIGSVAVLSDAMHTFSAVGGVLLAIVAARLASDRFSFGWYRAEIVGALANGAFLLIMAIVVIIMGAMRLADPIRLATGPMLWVALGGIVTEVIALAMLHKQQSGDLNVKDAYWHILQTFVGSLIIIVSALVIEFTGFLAIDPILGMAFGVVLLWASWGILRQATRVLMDGTPEGISLGDLARELGELDDVEDVHHVHGWALTSGRYVFSGHLKIAEGGDPQAVLEAAHAILRDGHGFYFSTLQIETRCLDEDHAEVIDITARLPRRARARTG